MEDATQTVRILVTGANGKLGRMLRTAWGAGNAGRIEYHYMSRTADADTCWSPGQALPDLPRCDAIIALWGCTSGTAEALAVNTDLTAHCLTLAHATGATHVLHLSSAAVYGPGEDLTEAAPLHPINDYGRAKIAMEQHVSNHTTPGVAQCCLRLANVMGADSLAPALGPGSDAVSLPRFADGRGPVRSYASPGFLAECLPRLAQLPAAALPAALNVATANPVTMDDIARAAGKQINWRAPSSGDTQIVTMDTGLLYGLLPGLDTRRSASDMISEWTSLRTSA